MNEFENEPDVLCAVYVDLGTTNTRVWLMRGIEVLAQASKQVGVSDSAREGTTTSIRTGLKELIAKVQNQANHNSKSDAPVCVVAAGMISSPLGLAELAHIPSPAGMRDLAAATAKFAFPDITTLPFLLVPGVRSGSMELAGQVDAMRGEETLCVGLQLLDLVEPPAVVLTLGSHWKAIQLAADGRIQSSVTSLSGEMIDAVRTQTILASAVADNWPDEIAKAWLEAGIEEQRRSGLPRALFCVRLLELQNEGTASERFAYLLGAFIAADLDALVNRGVLASGIPIVISGHAAVAEAWAFALAKESIKGIVLTAEETESAFLSGLRSILIACHGLVGFRSEGPELNSPIRKGGVSAS